MSNKKKRKSLAKELSFRTGYQIQQCKDILDALCDIVMEEMSADGAKEIRIPNLMIMTRVDCKKLTYVKVRLCGRLKQVMKAKKTRYPTCHIIDKDFKIQNKNS